MASSKNFWPLVTFSLFLLCSLSNRLVSATSVSSDGRAIIINGERKLIFSGSIHYPRSTPQMWPDLIQKAKDGGLDAIETYVFWNGHEPRRREYNFEGNFDIVRFIKEIQNAGLYAILRIGPYACAEWTYGGLPAWLRQIPGMEFRTDNQPFKDEMQNFTTLIVDMLKQEKLLAPQGGPIIITQIENEYGNIQGPYGDAGKRYTQWCAKLAESFDIGIPWIMCQQSDAPQPMINTCNGFYCDAFQPNNPNSPKIYTENWTGWFKAWDKPDPYRLAEDLAFSVARFFQYKGSVMNYYMYHGGTNFGRTSGGPYITTTYDYDAPIDEYGNLRQPKWGHLKQLHAAIKGMEKALTYGDFNDTPFGNGVFVTKYSLNGTSSCFMSNANNSADATLTYEGEDYFLPAWSVSVLPDCKQEVYNTAKVNTQTSIMVKKPNQAENEPAAFKWSWRAEPLKAGFYGKGASFSSDKLLEQITFTADASDYLWYMSSVNVSQGDEMILRVNTTGHILHVFINGHLVGSQYGQNGQFSFVYERAVRLKAGTNYISLLSATVGLKNYGARFELMPAGIVDGPVQLTGGSGSLDLSAGPWSYKIGLTGEDREFYLEKPKQARKWDSSTLPTNRPFTWYKTTFKAPTGSAPVVVDLLGMGKGAAWVNGQSIGRFWPTYLASDMNGCKRCDYRGAFNPDNCRTGCKEPAQRWYHVPRSFLKTGEPNTLVLFEEAGGDPSQVNFQTVVVGTVCGSAPEGDTLALSCQGGQPISDVEFASFGNPQGTCQSFQKGSCDADVLSVVKKACIGQPSCSIDVSEKSLEANSTCGSIIKRLAVQAVC